MERCERIAAILRDSVVCDIQRDRDLWPQAGDEEQPHPAHAQPEQVAQLVGLMLDHGDTKEDIGKVLGGNFLRVMREAENRRN
jgi:hypothetical protein